MVHVGDTEIQIKKSSRGEERRREGSRGKRGEERGREGEGKRGEERGREGETGLELRSGGSRAFTSYRGFVLKG